MDSGGSAKGMVRAKYSVLGYLDPLGVCVCVFYLISFITVILAFLALVMGGSKDTRHSSTGLRTFTCLVHVQYFQGL